MNIHLEKTNPCFQKLVYREGSKFLKQVNWDTRLGPLRQKMWSPNSPYSSNSFLQPESRNMSCELKDYLRNQLHQGRTAPRMAYSIVKWSTLPKR